MTTKGTARLTYDAARDIFKPLSTSSCQDQFGHLIDKAATYDRIRVDWLRASKEQQIAMGAERTAHHDAFIASCVAMAEAMESAGEDTGWLSLLGTDRKTIGDFACFVHCILGQIAG